MQLPCNLRLFASAVQIDLLKVIVIFIENATFYERRV